MSGRLCSCHLQLIETLRALMWTLTGLVKLTWPRIVLAAFWVAAIACVGMCAAADKLVWMG